MSFVEGGRSELGQIALLAEQHPEAAPGRVASDTRAVDAAANDEKIVFARAQPVTSLAPWRERSCPAGLIPRGPCDVPRTLTVPAQKRRRNESGLTLSSPTPDKYGCFGELTFTHDFPIGRMAPRPQHIRPVRSGGARASRRECVTWMSAGCISLGKAGLGWAGKSTPPPARRRPWKSILGDFGVIGVVDRTGAVAYANNLVRRRSRSFRPSSKSGGKKRLVFKGFVGG